MFESSGEKSIHLEICSVKRVCTNDEYKVFVEEASATSQHTGLADSSHGPIGPTFTFECFGPGRANEAWIEEPVKCALGSYQGEIRTVTWSAPGGLPSGGELRNFETYYYDPGTKQIEIVACSSEGGCTSDIAVITIFETK